MDNDAIISGFDQAMELALRTIPGALRSFYCKLVDEEFDTKEALELTKVYLQCLFLAANKEGE